MDVALTLPFGQFDDPADRPSLAHLTEHLLLSEKDAGEDLETWLETRPLGDVTPRATEPWRTHGRCLVNAEKRRAKWVQVFIHQFVVHQRVSYSIVSCME